MESLLQGNVRNLIEPKKGGITMALTFNETKEMEELKQTHKKELAEITLNNAREEHEMKMKRLEILLLISKEGGVFKEDRD